MRPLVNSLLPESMLQQPARSLKRAPASSTNRSVAARSQGPQSNSTAASSPLQATCMAGWPLRDTAMRPANSAATRRDRSSRHHSGAGSQGRCPGDQQSGLLRPVWPRMLWS